MPNQRLTPIYGFLNPDASLSLLSDQFSSMNFDGALTRVYTQKLVSELKAGDAIHFSASENDEVIPVLVSAVELDDSEDTAYQTSPVYFIYYIDENGEDKNYTLGAKTTDGGYLGTEYVYTSYEDPTTIDVGTSGWTITKYGNAVFSNVFTRGTVEATAGKIDGILTIGADENTAIQLGKGISLTGDTSLYNGLVINDTNYFVTKELASSTYGIASATTTTESVDSGLSLVTFTINSHGLFTNTTGSKIVNLFGFTGGLVSLNDSWSLNTSGTNTITIIVPRITAGTYTGLSAQLEQDGITIRKSVTSAVITDVANVTNTNITFTASKTNAVTAVTASSPTTGSATYTATGHTFSVGDIIIVSGASISGYNGTFTITGVSTNTFTVANATTGATTFTSGLATQNHNYSAGSYINISGLPTALENVNGTFLISSVASNTFTIKNVTVTGTSITAVTPSSPTVGSATYIATGHTFVVGDIVTITGASVAGYNGTFTITAVSPGVSFRVLNSTTTTPVTFTSGLAKSSTYTGLSGSVYKAYNSLSSVFNVGSVNNFMNYDSSTDILNVTGKIISGSGSIGGWILQPSYFYSGDGASRITFDSTNGKIAIGTGNFGTIDTGFYADKNGKFSLSNQLTFTPVTAAGRANVFTTGTTSGTTITVTSATGIGKGMTVAGTGIAAGTTVTDVVGTIITITPPVTTNQSTAIPISFILDDMSELLITGRIKGVIESVTPITSPRLSTTITNANITGTSPNQIATFTTNGHAFLPNEKIFVEGLPGTNGLSNLNNREYTISDVLDSITLTVSISGIVNKSHAVTGVTPSSPAVGSATYAAANHTFVVGDVVVISGAATAGYNGRFTITGVVSGASGTFTVVNATISTPLTFTSGLAIAGATTSPNSGLSATASLRELTMGLHPAEGLQGTDSWYHSAGTGLRLDKYNWWLTNNQFRVGNVDSYFGWNGSKFVIQGSGTKTLQMSVGLTNADNYYSIVNTGSTPAYANANTPFFVNSEGKFSLGTALTWDGSTLTIAGVSGGIQPGNGIGVNPSNQITTISGSSGLTISSGLTTGARVQLDSSGLKAWNASNVNTVAINSDGSASFTGTITGSTIIGGTVTTDTVGGSVALDGTNDSLRFKNSAEQNVGWITYLSTATLNGLMINVGSSPLRDPANQTSALSPMLYMDQSGIYMLTENSSGSTAGLIIDEGSAQSIFFGNVETNGSFVARTSLISSNSGNGANAVLYNSYSLYSSEQLSIRAARGNNSAFDYITMYELYGTASSDVQARISGTGRFSTDATSSTYNGADYAEFFEWEDGNINDEDRRGMVVTLNDDLKIEVYSPEIHDENSIIGIVSSNPSIIGNSPLKWKGKYLKDEWGSEIIENCSIISWMEYDEIKKENIEIWYYQDMVPSDIIIPEDAVVKEFAEDGITRITRSKINPEYDSSLEYLPREERKEWASVGLVGVIKTRKDQHLKSSWIRTKEISENLVEVFIK